MRNNTVSIVLTKRECNEVAQCLQDVGEDFEVYEETSGERASMDPKRLLVLSRWFRHYAEPDH